MEAPYFRLTGRCAPAPRAAPFCANHLPQHLARRRLPHVFRGSGPQRTSILIICHLYGAKRGGTLFPSYRPLRARSAPAPRAAPFCANHLPQNLARRRLPHVCRGSGRQRNSILIICHL